MSVNIKSLLLDPKIMTVSELNRQTSQVLGDNFLSVLVAGEISNLSAPTSGHLYFTLKDPNAQVRCAMFRNQQRRLSVVPENGKLVIVKAQVGLYEPRGDYQLIVEHIDAAGDGALQKAFEALKRKLSAEGMFDSVHKQGLPVLPKAIGVITSSTGAAVRDVLTVLKRRFSAIPVIIYPVSVQGFNAKNEIAQALVTANRLNNCEVIILARGGGSLEDLWAFNEEIVARAIFASKIPVISGIGHETDVTIADYVADVRAATPTAAAEFASPDYQQWQSQYIEFESRLIKILQRNINQMQQSLDWISKRLEQQHPGQKLAIKCLRIDELELRLQYSLQTVFRHHTGVIEAKVARLWQFNPAIHIKSLKLRESFASKRLSTIIERRLELGKQRFIRASQTLHAVSPLATLNRGYALAIHNATGEIVRSPEQLKIGDRTETRIAKGSYVSEVISVASGQIDACYDLKSVSQ
jgi:exodeoxyribonuclease VII large subunit